MPLASATVIFFTASTSRPWACGTAASAARFMLASSWSTWAPMPNCFISFAALPSLPPFSAALSLASASASALSARTGKRVFSRTSSNNWRIGELAASSPETWSAPSPASLNGSRPRRPTASLQKFA